VVSLAIAAAVLGLLNAIVLPILRFLTLPLTLLSLGLFLIVLNALMLELTDWLVTGFEINASCGRWSERWSCRSSRSSRAGSGGSRTEVADVAPGRMRRVRRMGNVVRSASGASGFLIDCAGPHEHHQESSERRHGPGHPGVIKLGESAREFSSYLEKVLNDETGPVMINFESINYMDSTGSAS